MAFAPPTGNPTSTRPPGVDSYTVNLDELDKMMQHNVEIVKKFADDGEWTAYAVAEASRALAHSAALESCLGAFLRGIYTTLGYPTFEAAVKEFTIMRTDLQERALHPVLHVIQEKIVKKAPPSKPSGYL